MRTLLVLASLCLNACIASRNGAFVPPAQYDVAPVSSVTSEGAEQGTQFKGALSWASLSANPKTPVDVRVGYLVENYEDADRETIRRPNKDVKTREVDRTLHGPFLEVSRRIKGGKYSRFWVGGRAEMLVGKHRGYGASSRLAYEIMKVSKSRQHRGAVGLGVFLELGVRRFRSAPSSVFSAAGLSGRLPMVVVH